MATHAPSGGAVPPSARRTSALGRFLEGFPASRKLFWRGAYGLLGSALRRSSWPYLNYGYADADGSAPIPDLLPEDEPYRLHAQLYARVLSGVEVASKRVLEVGCGRGGGSSFVARYLAPRSVIGLDFSSAAVEFCRRTHPLPNLGFEVGDAERMPLPDASFDVVLNVESSHCYASLARFAREVVRVMRPGGVFAWADLVPRDGVVAMEEELAPPGLHCTRSADISEHVLRSLDVSVEMKERRIREAPRAFRDLLRTFVGLPGTEVYDDLRSGKLRYLTRISVRR